ncbi:hypothetical protein [Limosilactobacillus antri]|uniref:Uncharacterized protein n=1 Tax=Limosilactobacillus antri DSM 16041 TaxID=525309 RepID=C8P519_9LACO|nr:hypothetical protein [Limosilactobacillus antri]EEW54425.1 hypothetical protein HMPREF0494_0413 [Limosilactobacillus antri DSM 16041]KRK59811.1 hypothetical protein FC31_GL000338 [Limosilactobacillus antri DSM 16041]
MFYNNFDNVYGEDRYGMVGKTGDGFREDRQLAIPCYRCHREPLIIAERNWMDTNRDDSQRYQIIVCCAHCGATDQFIVNDGREKQIGRLRHAHVRPSEQQLG